MPRPQVVVTVAAASPRRGIDSDTGRTFLVYPAGTGPTTPTLCLTGAQATAAGVTPTYAQYVSDALTEGSPDVVVVRAEVTPENAAAAPLSVWANALAKLDVTSYGAGQVIIPGVAAPNAHDALVAHAASSGRTVLLDGDVDATSTELVAFANAQQDKAGATRAGLIAAWVKATGAAGVDRVIPGSVIAAGLAGRSDGRVGHAGGVPAFTQNGAGISRLATDVTATYSTGEQDSLADHGVSPFIARPGQVILGNWRSISSDARWSQLQFGRLAMQIANGASGTLDVFLGRTIDAQGLLHNEVQAAVVSQLAQLEAANALYGSGGSSYRVTVSNDPDDAAAGLIRVSIEVQFSKYAERVEFDVVVYQPGAMPTEGVA